MRPVYAINPMEKAIESTYKFLKEKNFIYGIAFGYIGSCLISSVDDIFNNVSIPDILQQYCEISGTTIILALSIIVVLSYTMLLPILNDYLKKRTVDKRFLEIVQNYMDPIFENQVMEGYGWGKNKTFVSSPDTDQGVKTVGVSFEVSSHQFKWSQLVKVDPDLSQRDIEGEYQQYIKKEDGQLIGDFWKSFNYDSDRLMLVKRPQIYTDDNGYNIDLQNVKWSQLQFFWNHVLKSDEQKKKYIDLIYGKEKVIFVPNSFCLHLVVLTTDKKILLTRNSSNKKSDCPGAWTATIGEQLDAVDLKGKSDKRAYEWVKRAFLEELDLKDQEIPEEQVRFMSINCEGNVCNFTFMCIAEITLSAQEMDDHLKVAARKDNEFDDYEFLDINDIPDLLLEKNGEKELHPSTAIRLLYTYIYCRGDSRFRSEILQKHFKNTTVNHKTQ